MDSLLELLEEQWIIERKFRPVEGQNGFWPEFAYPVDDYPVPLDDPMGQAFIKDAQFRMVEELMEAANLLKNRPWKQTLRPVDREAFDEETADFLHFFLRYFLILYGNPSAAKSAMLRIYFKKAETNHQRYEEGV